MKTLKLTRMGCQILPNDELSNHTDFDNYRLRGQILDHDNNIIDFDVMRSSKYRFTHLRDNTKKLKKPILEHSHKLYIDAQYRKQDGYYYSYKSDDISNFINDNNLCFNKTDLLKLINFISQVKYTEIEVK